MSEPVKQHLLTPPRLTLKCHNGCGVMLRVYRVEPGVAVGAFRYCPLCGSQNVSQYMDADMTQWESLSRDYDLPIEVIKQLYQWWLPTHHRRFSDFILEVKADVQAGRVPAQVQQRLDAEQRAQERTRERERANLPPRPVLKIPGAA